MKSTLFNHKKPSSQPSVSATTIDHLPSSTLTDHYLSDEEETEDLESIVRTIKSSKRLFFSPENSNSILNQTTNDVTTMMISTMAMESMDPYMDFKSSMEEMVEMHGLHDWEFLEELLGCYLMLNDKTNHCYIVQAFADLVLHQLMTTANMSDLASDSFVTSFSSPLDLSSTAETSCSSSSIAPAEGGGQ